MFPQPWYVAHNACKLLTSWCISLQYVYAIEIPTINLKFTWHDIQLQVSYEVFSSSFIKFGTKKGMEQTQQA